MKVRYLLLALLLSLPLGAGADPGAGAWVTEKPYGVYVFTYTFTSDVHSAVKVLGDGLWTICFDPDTLLTDGASTGTVQIRRQIGATATDLSSTILTADAVSTLTGAAGASCFFNVPGGAYWVDVAVSPGGDTAVVTIQPVFREK